MSSWFFMMWSQPSSTAFDDPGRLKISVPFANPAKALDWIVDVPISLNESCRNNSPNPVISLSKRGPIASGVLSRPVKPVPPDVIIT